MRRALVAAGAAIALTVAGATVVSAAGESVPVGCTITDNVLSCPLPAPAAPVTVTSTVTPAPVTTTATVTQPPVTSTVTVTAAPTSSTPTSSTPTSPTPTTPPVQTGFPNASNTGVPAGVTLTNSGGLTITAAGTVVDAKNITGTVQINANNVTIKRSKITGSGYAIVRVQDGRTGVRLEDVEINGRGTSGTSNSGGVIGSATILRANIYGVENGVVPYSNSVIQESWIHNLGAPGSPHYDGVQMDGGATNIMVDHNTIDLSGLGQTGAIMVDNYYGQITGITVKNSRLLGGGYTVYCDGNFQSQTITGISYLNNRIAGGSWGPFLIRNCNATVTGNVHDVTGAPISN